MGNRLTFVAVALLLGLGVAYLMFGPNVFLGGPTKSAIVDATRAAMITAAASAEEDAAAKAADIVPQGLCARHDGDSLACMVEITLAGAAPKAFISVLRQDDTGAWVPVP